MKINFFSPINSLGVGVHSSNLIKAFEKLNHQITLIPPFGKVEYVDDDINRWLANRESFSPKNPSIMIFDIAFMTQFSGFPRIGMCVFETGQFTDVQLAAMKSLDYIFTPTRWGQEVLANHGLKSIVVNEGFDPDIFLARKKSISEEMEQPFTFIHVGKLEERKGTMQAVRCFAQALDKEEARLILHINNPFLQIPAEKQVREVLNKMGFYGGQIMRRENLTIEFTHPFQNVEAIADLYAQADCGLFPSKAEGWGLCLLECLASGIPVIAGNWTGQSEYLSCLDKDYPYFIKVYDKKIADDGLWFHGDKGEWNVPKDENLKTIILEAFHNARAFRKQDKWKMQVENIRQFTWSRAANQLQDAVNDVCGL